MTNFAEFQTTNGLRIAINPETVQAIAEGEQTSEGSMINKGDVTTVVLCSELTYKVKMKFEDVVVLLR